MMFDRIARRYDFLNRVLSLRRDVAWRKQLSASLPNRDGLRVLDLATGTADVLLSLNEGRTRLAKGVGLDMSANMLALGREKAARSNANGSLAFVRSDACSIGIGDETFDAATMAFGIRNVSDIRAALKEIYRVLAPSGRVLILEFSLPSNALFRAFYLFYFRHVLPRVGGLISGDRNAYQYLNRSVEEFPSNADFCKMMSDAGFKRVDARPLTFGIATIFQGDK